MANMFNRYFVLAIIILSPALLFSATDIGNYDFVGHHFVASLVGCDHDALTNVEGLAQAMEKAVLASGATILSSSKHVFPGNGLTMIILLSESHASIHTYPEYGACFIDLFTCGHHCSAKEFEKVLQEYLKPQSINKRMLLRDAHIHDEA
jgi:S-adenosylmethionine decarboxylase